MHFQQAMEKAGEVQPLWDWKLSLLYFPLSSTPGTFFFPLRRLSTVQFFPLNKLMETQDQFST